MSAHIKRLYPKEKQTKQQDLFELQSILERFPELKERDISNLVWKIKKENKLSDPNRWTFIMISPEQNKLVVNWLDDNSTQPRKSVRLWALLFENVHRETGQIMLSRQELADKMNLRPNNISRIMSELESINAILKKKEGRGVIYYMNPNVANHYPQEIREKKQKNTPEITPLNRLKL